MKQKPPYYELDLETRKLAEQVVAWARQLEQVQQQPNTMLSVIESVERRLLLTPPQTPDPRGTRAEVVALRPFRVITTNESVTQNESQ